MAAFTKVFKPVLSYQFMVKKKEGFMNMVKTKKGYVISLSTTKKMVEKNGTIKLRTCYVVTTVPPAKHKKPAIVESRYHEAAAKRLFNQKIEKHGSV